MNIIWVAMVNMKVYFHKEDLTKQNVPLFLFNESMVPASAKLQLSYWGRDKMALFSRRHFQMHFLERKCMNFDCSFTEVCSYGSN